MVWTSYRGLNDIAGRISHVKGRLNCADNSDGADAGKRGREYVCVCVCSFSSSRKGGGKEESCVNTWLSALGGWGRRARIWPHYLNTRVRCRRVHGGTSWIRLKSAHTKWGQAATVGPSTIAALRGSNKGKLESFAFTVSWCYYYWTKIFFFGIPMQLQANRTTSLLKQEGQRHLLFIDKARRPFFPHPAFCLF